MEQAFKIINGVLDLVAAGKATLDQVNAIRAKVAAMQAQGRDPTDAEWNDLFDHIQQNTDALQSAADEAQKKI